MERNDNKIVKVDAMPPIKSAVLFGSIILFFFASIFILWSVFSPLESAAVAQGQVKVDTYKKTIQHLEGGIVKEFKIREGSKVEEGDLLIKLDGTQAQATLDLLKGQANELLSAESRLIAERDESKEIVYSKILLEQKGIPKVKKIMDSQRSIFITRNKAFNGQLKILNKRIGQLRKEIESLQAQQTAEDTQLALIGEEIEAVEYLEKRKLIEKPRLLALKREAARLKGDRDENTALIARTEQKIGETESQIITITHNQQKEVLEELRETQKRLAEIQERQKAAQDILDRTYIRAPSAGTVVNLTEHTIGGVIKPGENVLDIVPSKDRLIIEARIDPLDIDIVHKGLVAKVQLTAFKQRSTPTLEGRVEHVSADSFEDPNTGVRYYLARVVIPEKELGRLKDIKLYPGMPAQVMIIIDRRTPFAYFISPIRDSFHRAFREQ